MKKIFNSLALVFCAFAVASQAQTTDGNSSKPATDSFKTVNKRASNLIRVNPQANWGSYGAYRLAPATYEPSGSKHLLEAWEVRRLEDVLDGSLGKTFKKQTAGEGPALEVRPILTDFKRTNTLLNVIGFAAIQAPISFGGASVRYELVDAASGDQIGVVSCQRNARPWNVYPWNVVQNFETLGQGSVILKSDSRRLRKDLELLAKIAIKPETKVEQEPAKGAE